MINEIHEISVIDTLPWEHSDIHEYIQFKTA